MNRPDSPTFLHLAEIARRIDKYAEGQTGNAVENALSEIVIDSDSILYVAHQRMMRIRNIPDIGLEEAAIIAWHDAFIMGYLLASGATGWLPPDPGPTP